MENKDLLGLDYAEWRASLCEPLGKHGYNPRWLDGSEFDEVRQAIPNFEPPFTWILLVEVNPKHNYRVAETLVSRKLAELPGTKALRAVHLGSERYAWAIRPPDA